MIKIKRTIVGFEHVPVYHPHSAPYAKIRPLGWFTKLVWPLLNIKMKVYIKKYPPKPETKLIDFFRKKRNW